MDDAGCARSSALSFVSASAPLLVAGEILPAAILCDQDGTLADSEDWWFEAEVEVFARYGVEWTIEDVHPFVGCSIPYFTSEVCKRYGFPVTPEVLRDELLETLCARARTLPTPWRPGARELLELSVELGIPSALVTSSLREFATLVMKDAPEGALEEFVTGDLPIPGKPNPDPYLEAARRLGVDIKNCLVFEDSPYGVEAALAAGAAVVQVPYMVDVEPQQGLTKLATLEGIDSAALADFLAAPRR